MLTIDREFTVSTLSRLVQINSVNPTLSPAGAGEAEVGRYVAQTLKGLGLEVASHEPEPGRVSVVGKLKGTGKGQFAKGETNVRARVDVGNLRVIVPNDIALRVDGDAQLGQVQMLGKTADGRNVDRHVAETGKRELVLKAHVGVGKVQVTRAVR